jgi:flagellar hook-associated protein 3 FlgL
MRVTQSMLFTAGMVGVNDARAREERAIAEASSGVRVAHPGDDPAAAGQIVVHRLNATRLDAIGTAVERASNELGSADVALGSLANVFSRAREIAVQLSNSTYSANERAAGATEVRGLIQSAIGILNTRVGNRYIFGGYKDAAPPFDSAGVYQGDTGVRQVEIAPGVVHDASIRADVVAAGAGGGVDILATLSTLETALAGNNQAGVSATLDDLQSSISQVALGRAQSGTAMSVLDGATAAARTAMTSEKTNISSLADADAIDATSRLAQADQALNAALTATARGFSLSLVDKLR